MALIFALGTALTSGPKAAERVIVAFGDSLTAGYGLAAAEAFPKQLETRLRQDGLDVRVHNAGVSGDTTAGGRARLAWAVPEPVDLVIVELGANDALRGIPPETAKRNLDDILARLTERGIGVLLAGMRAPNNFGRAYAQAFNAIYPDLAARHRVDLYPFFLDGIALKPEYILADGLHPNALGIGKIVEGILPHVKAALAKR